MSIISHTLPQLHCESTDYLREVYDALKNAKSLVGTHVLYWDKYEIQTSGRMSPVNLALFYSNACF